MNFLTPFSFLVDLELAELLSQTMVYIYKVYMQAEYNLTLETITPISS